MKLVHLGMISTGVVIMLGLAMVVPAFTQQKITKSIPSVMLTFTLGDSEKPDLGRWCEDLSSVINKHGVRATVFVSGAIAEETPECVNSFPAGIDVGSQTYSYVSLTSISNYDLALEEVKKGKEAIDKVGGLESRLFRAPYGHVDENIYSYLTRSGIVADFSYSNHYNKFENDLFVKYDIKELSGNREGLELYSLLSRDDDVVRPESPVPIGINFDSSSSTEDIDSFITDLKTIHDKNIEFVNASDLVGLSLTIRGVSRS